MNHTVVRITIAMLSIAALGQTDYYIRLAQEEYYDPQKSGERPGVLLGRGAELLRLRGHVSKQEFKSLMRGVHPRTKEPLRKTAGKRTKDAAWDLVLSLPKSWSVMLATTEGPRVRKKLEHSFDRSVAQFVERLEEVTYSRVGRSSTPVPAKPVISCFVHTCSRAEHQDPRWHAHLVLKNLGVREDNTTGAILSRPYYVRKMAMGALFRCDLAYALQQEFPGIEFRKTKTGVEIAGFPQPLLRHFSTRRRQIEAEVGDPDNATAIAKAVACLKTRQRRKLIPPLSQLRVRWRYEARRFGFGQPEIANLLRRRPPQPIDKPKVLDEAFGAAVAQLTYRHSHFSELDVLRYSAEAATGRGATGQDVEVHVARELRHSPNIEPLGKLRGRKRYSTPDILKQEEKLLGVAEKMASQPSHRITLAGLCVRLSLESAAATRHWLTLESDPSLRSDQRDAIKFLAQRSGRVALLTARTGTTKLDTLARLGELYRASGNTVLAAAPTGRGARRLTDEANLPALTLKTFLNFAASDRSLAAGAKHATKQLIREAAGRYIGLYPYKRRPLLTRDTVVIVDAAQQISTQAMDHLLSHARRAGSKILLVGNPDGLQSIERGVPFASLARRLPKAELTEIVRPRGRQDARNVERVRAGKAKTVIQDLARRGRLHVAASREAAIERLLADWQSAGGVESPEDHLIVVSTDQEAKQVNHRASQIRRASQKNTGSNTKDQSIILPSGEKIFLRDRIRCTRRSRRYDVEAGSLGTLIGVSQRLNSIQLELDRGDHVTLPLVTYPHVTRGYAQTIWHAAPAQNAYLLLGGAYEDRQAALVKFSRGSETTRAYIDHDYAGPELDELSRQLSLDRSKTLAADVRRQPEAPQQER